MARLFRNQNIRLITGQLIVLNVDQLPFNGDYTRGVAYLDDFELELEQVVGKCCFFSGEQWVELGIRQCLDIWLKNDFDAEEVDHVRLTWVGNHWMADLLVDGADLGIAFTFDDEGDMHIEEVSPYMIVV